MSAGFGCQGCVCKGVRLDSWQCWQRLRRGESAVFQDFFTILLSTRPSKSAFTREKSNPIRTIVAITTPFSEDGEKLERQSNLIVLSGKHNPKSYQAPGILY